MTDSNPADLPPFHIVSIDRSSAPAGATGDDWCHYVIAQGDNAIDGMRRGSIASVTEAVEFIVSQLNQRRQRQGGKQSPPSRSPGRTPTPR